MAWLSGYPYKKSITLSRASSAVTNYQMKLLVTEDAQGDPEPLISQTQVWTGSESWTAGQQALANDLITKFGLGWVRYPNNPIFGLGAAGKWDDGNVQMSSIILDGSTWRLFYNGSRSGLTNQRIGLATSTDGKTWTRYSVNNPVLDVGGVGTWDHDGVVPGGVIKEGSTLKMWYNGYGGASQGIGLATSTDGGQIWTKDANNPILTPSGSGWDNMWVVAPKVIKEGSTYKMWYVGYNTAPTVPQIGYATSPDGITWTKYGSNPVLLVGGGGAWDSVSTEIMNVFKIANKYVIFYEGSVGSPARFKIGVASSSDGITWTKHASNPIFSYSSVDGQWDDYHVIHPCVVWNPVAGQFFLYYAGTDGTDWDEVAKIGLATLQGDVSCEGHCQTDFDDLRFTTSDGTTLLDYWIENISGTTPNQVATVWIEFDSIGTGATTFYIYYGKADAAVYSNGDNTFLFFDHFDVDLSKWTTGGTPAIASSILTLNSSGENVRTSATYGVNTALRSRMYYSAVPAAAEGNYMQYGDWATVNSNCRFSEQTTGTDFQSISWDDAGTGQTTTLAAMAREYHIYEIKRNSTTNVQFEKDNVNVATHSVRVGTLARYIGFYNSSSKIIYSDWILVRQFLGTGPVWGVWGGEETLQDMTFIASGGSLSGGSVSLVRGVDKSSIGGALIGGNVNYERGISIPMAGGLLLGGIVDYIRGVSIPMLGGVLTGGESTISSFRVLSILAQGGVVVGGEVDEVRGLSLLMNGGAIVAGESDITSFLIQILSIIGNGGGIVGDSALIQKMAAFLANGGVLIGGDCESLFSTIIKNYAFKRDQQIKGIPSQGGNFVYRGDSNSIPAREDGEFETRIIPQIKPLIRPEGYDWFYSEWFGEDGWFHGISAQAENSEYIFGKLGSIMPEVPMDGNLVIEPQSSIKPPSLPGSFEFGKL